MFTSERVKKTLLVAGVVSSLLFVGCQSSPSLEKNIDGSVIYPIKDGHYNAYKVNTQNMKGFTYGRKPTANEIKAWDVDVMPDGTGLPEGQGSVEDGDALYSTKCAMCHGEFGIGGKGYPPLSGGQGTLKFQLLEPGDPAPIRTIGSYWPYASTLYWYIKTAMPFPAPKSLSDDQVYAIVAYLLAVNEITIDGEELDDEYVLNREKFLKIKMPNENGFYPISPDRRSTAADEAGYLKEQRGPLAQGERCMKDCDAPGVVSIGEEITGFDPPISTKKSLPADTSGKKVSFGEKIYTETCSACHANDAIGAPVVGNKEAWMQVLKKGKRKVYRNGINGINAMPPKGGNMDLSDAEFKKVVDYMIQASK